MKLDKDYTSVVVCPDTGLDLSNNEVSYSSGICPRCGHNDGSTFTHSKHIIGKWEHANVWDLLCGKFSVFHRKDEE